MSSFIKEQEKFILDQQASLEKIIEDIINQSIVDTIDLSMSTEMEEGSDEYLNKSKEIVHAAAMKINMTVKMFDFVTAITIKEMSNE